MKKKIAIIALALIGVGTLGMNAQNRAQCQREACPLQQSTAAGDNNKMYQPREFTELAFEGILLDQNQQVQINEIHNQLAQQRQECQQQCANDSAACPCNAQQCRQGRRDHRGHHQGRPECTPVCREYVNQVKAVLTPEQYTTFLENILFMGQTQQENTETVNPNARGRMGAPANARREMRQGRASQQGAQQGSRQTPRQAPVRQR